MVMKSLSEVDELILEHVARYRLTVPRAMAGMKLLGNSDLAAAEAKLRELVSSGWLNKAPLVAGDSDRPSYFYLSVRAAAHLGQDLAWAQPIKRDMRIECFARVAFCCEGKKFRQAFTKAEFTRQFAHLWFPGQPVQYYLEPADKRHARLAFLKVDRDGEGRWDRLIDSCSRFLKQRTCPRAVAPQYQDHVSAFAKLVARDQFQFTVLTALPDKKHAIEIELERRQLAGKPAPPIDVHVVDGLFELLCPTILA